MRNTDTLYRIGMWLLTGTALYTGLLWWRWLVERMGPSNAESVLLQIVLAAVVFVPLLLFVWLMARLLMPSGNPKQD